MKLEKLLRVINKLRYYGVSLHSMVYANSTGELRIAPTGQPSELAHSYLLGVGFVFVDGDYIYRPK